MTVHYPKKTAEEILKDALPNEFLISVIDKDFELEDVITEEQAKKLSKALQEYDLEKEDKK